MPTRTERQRERRRWMRERGWKRLDIEVSPQLWEKLLPHVREYGAETHAGAALISFLEAVKIETLPE